MLSRIRTLGLALAVFTLSALTWWHPAPAAAAGKEGHCTDDKGVTVVIDFQALGGGSIVRCATDFTGGTGVDALHAAGISIEGTKRYGEGFICRIENRPTASEKLPVKGKEGYQEPCIDTPPSAAYWSYWHADNGGSWTYSQAGGKNRNAIVGGYEGWSFSMNASATTNPAPGVAPQRPAPEPEPEPEPTDSTSAPGGPGKDSSSQPGQEGSDGSEGKKPDSKKSDPKTPGTKDSRAKDPKRRGGSTPSASPSAKRTPSPSATPTPTPTATPTPTPTPSGTRTRSRPTTAESGSSAVPTATVDSPGGPPLGTVLGIGGVVGLGAVSAVVLGLRRGGGGFLR